MKKLLLFPLLFLSLISTPCLSETMDELVKRDGIYYKKSTDTLFTGAVTGTWQGRFENGVKIGEWAFYHDNGQLHSKGSFRNGVHIGEWIFYHDNGQLWKKVTFKNGVKEGELVGYHDNGRFSGKITHKNGLLDGEMILYHRNGRLHSKVSYKNGVMEGEFVGYHDNGRLKSKSSYKNGVMEGESVIYYDNGQLSSKGSYKNGVMEGESVSYHKNGQLEIKGSFKNGEPEGEWVHYHDNGTVNKKGTGTFKSNGMAEWLKYAGNDEETHYYMPESIRILDDKAKVWALVDFKSVKTLDTYRYLSGKVQHQFDCQEEQSKLLYSAFYSENMGEGDVVLQVNLLPHANWAPIMPETMLELLFKRACSR